MSVSCGALSSFCGHTLFFFNATATAEIYTLSLHDALPIIAREEISTWQPGAHGSTFGGNPVCCAAALATLEDRKSTRLNSSHPSISYAVLCLKKKNRLACSQPYRHFVRLTNSHRGGQHVLE